VPVFPVTDLLPGGVGLHIEAPPPAWLRWAETCQARADAAHPMTR
jgi:hypothetical protein